MFCSRLAFEQPSFSGKPRRNWHRIPWNNAGEAVYSADERLHQRKRRWKRCWKRNEIPSLVRPHSGFPQLRNSMDSIGDHVRVKCAQVFHNHLIYQIYHDSFLPFSQILGGRRADSAVHEKERRHFPNKANVGLRFNMGRVLMGDRGWKIQGGLSLPAVRRQVQKLQNTRVHGGGSGILQAAAGDAVCVRRAESAAILGDAVGAEELLGVRLLQWSEERPHTNTRVLKTKLEPQKETKEELFKSFIKKNT